MRINKWHCLCWFSQLQDEGLIGLKKHLISLFMIFRPRQVSRLPKKKKIISLTFVVLLQRQGFLIWVRQ